MLNPFEILYLLIEIFFTRRPKKPAIETKLMEATYKRLTKTTIASHVTIVSAEKHHWKDGEYLELLFTTGDNKTHSIVFYNEEAEQFVAACNQAIESDLGKNEYFEDPDKPHYVIKKAANQPQ